MRSEFGFRQQRGQWLVSFGIALFLCLVIVLAPAALIDWAIRDATSGRARMALPTGTIWNGSGYVSAAGSPDAFIRWRLSPLYLLAGELRASVGQGAEPDGMVIVQFSGISLARIDLRMPVGVLAQMFEPTARAGLGGSLRLQSEFFTMGEQYAKGRIKLDIRDLDSTLARVSPLGSFELVVDGVDRRASIELSTIRGPLNGAGKGYWTWRGAGEFLGSLSAAPDRQSDLLAVLSVAGVVNSAGATELRFPRK